MSAPARRGTIQRAGGGRTESFSGTQSTPASARSAAAAAAQARAAAEAQARVNALAVARRNEMLAAEAMSMPRQTVNQGPYMNIPSPADRGIGIDTHEWQNIEMRKQTGKDVTYNSSGFNANITAATIPGAGINNIEIYFDSARKISSDPTNGTVSFNIPAINNNNSVSNCVAIRILPFYFPRLTPPLTTRPDVWFYKRLYIRMSGLPSTAVMASGNSQHHFEMEVGNVSGLNNISVNLDPIGENDEGGVFRFMAPQTSITDISFQFLKPIFTTNTQSLTPINIPLDIVVLQAVPLSNPAQFTILNLGVDAATIFSQQPAAYPIVPAAPGLAVFFTGFNSIDYTTPDYTGTNAALNTLVNSPDGWMVTRLVDATTIEVAGLDFSSILAETFPVPPPPPYKVPAPPICQMLIGANRIAFRVQFVCIVDKPTNYTQLIQI